MSDTTLTETRIEYGTRVQTPDGIGNAIAMDTSGQKKAYLVAFSRSDFSPAAWVRMSPSNGPSVFRMYDADLLSIVDNQKAKAKQNA